MRVILAIGSNIGNRFQYINQAFAKIRGFCKVLRTGQVYETKPMLVTNQPLFLNTVCEVETELSPEDLLKNCKRIEKELDRKERQRYGPREIDIDIIFYGNQIVNIHSEDKKHDLIIPHPLCHERSFVMKPMCDIDKHFVHPVLNMEVQEILKKLNVDDMYPVTCLDGKNLHYWHKNSLIMGILNVTPDSFSDGGRYNSVNAAVEHALQMIQDGVDIIDIGGESTRPGSDRISEEEEINRIVPVIHELIKITEKPISVDTTRSNVAKAAINAGAHIVNDISGGAMDPNMFETVAKLNVPYILMHMKGTPSTMNNLCNYKDVTSEVAVFINTQIEKAQLSGIQLYNIITDPGLGFAKDTQQNLTLLRELPRFLELTNHLPTLIAPSRKRFIGAVTGCTAPLDRVNGTVGVCCASVMDGADMVRVHDVKQTKEAIQMINAIKYGWKAN